MTTQHKMTSREAQRKEDLLLDLYKLNAYIPNDAEGNPLTSFGNFAEGYRVGQASQESQAEYIAQLELNNKFKDDRIAQLQASLSLLTETSENWQSGFESTKQDLTIAERTIAQLQLDNARMREKMHMAKIQGSRADCNLILNEALATQPTLAERGYKDIKYLACSKCGVMPDEAIATRLRRVCTALKLTSAVPDDDLELYRCMFSVLGIIARKLETQPTEYNPFINEGK